MKKLNTILLILFLFWNLSCSKHKEKAATFIQYLNETFNEKDIIKEKTFVIIPCSGCSGCDQSVYSLFSKHFLNKDNITLIICNPNEKGLLSPKLNANNVKYDFFSKMAEYDFGYGYPSCIIVKDNLVIQKYMLTPEIIHNLIK